MKDFSFVTKYPMSKTWVFIFFSDSTSSGKNKRKHWGEKEYCGSVIF
jgi:hypothetical protein